MVAQLIAVAVSLALASPIAAVQGTMEPLSVWAVHDNASYYDEREIVVSGYVVDSHTEWYGSDGSDYMTWNLVISDDAFPDEQSRVLLCYESGFNIDRIRECAEIADIQKELERQITVVGEYDKQRDILNLRKFLYFEDGEPRELDTDVSDREQVRVYESYGGNFDYDIHYTVWYRHSYIRPRPIWWVWWEPIYVVRPPTRYVFYYTPWCTYRRRIHPIRVAPHTRTVVHHDSRTRIAPNHQRHDIRGPGRVRTEPRVSRERVGAPSPRHTVERSGSETQRVRVRPEVSSPPERTRSPERQRVAPERSGTPTVREAPAPSPVRSQPRTRSEVRSGSSTQQRTPESSAPSGSVRSAPRTRSEVQSSTSTQQRTRVSSSPGGSIGTRSTSHEAPRVSSSRGSSVSTRSVSRQPTRVSPSAGVSSRGHSVSARQSTRPSSMGSSVSRSSFGGARRR
jgi:hypothetical protein